MKRVYYNQADSRWANHPYTSPSHPNATIKSGGCGATSGAMIISSFIKTIRPDEMGDIFKKNGLRANEGTDPRAFTWIAEKYGLNCKTTLYIKDAVECLKKGGMCVAYCRAGGLFSTGGHIIVLADIRGNDLVVYDPYLYKNKFVSGNRKCVRVNGNEAIVSVDNFKKYCNYNLYCYTEKNTPQPTKDPYKNGDIVEVTTPMYYTGYSIGNQHQYDTRAEIKMFSSETRTLIKNDSMTARCTFVCYAENDTAIVQLGKPFNDQFKVKKECVKRKL